MCRTVLLLVAFAAIPAAAVFPQGLMKCSVTPVLTTTCLSGEDYDNIAADVVRLLDSVNTTCTPTSCPRATFAGCVVRMAGHDFMDFKNGAGGSDGCVDFNDPDNLGLEDCLHTGVDDGVSIQMAYANWCHKVSLADFFVLAAEALMKETATASIKAEFKKNFQYGRVTAEKCDNNPALPNPEESCKAVKTNFIDALGLDVEGAAALMGVHTLGRAEAKNSGYDGWWSAPHGQKQFNNDYYKSILLKGWIPEKAVGGNAKKNQWQRADKDSSHEMMLNTDLCFVYGEFDEINKKKRPAGAKPHPVNAATDQCCTWIHRNSMDADKVMGVDLTGVAKLDKSEKICGSAGNPGPTQCCGNRRDPTRGRDCGDIVPGSFTPVGIGGDHTGFRAMRTFAADEQAWMDKFVPSWNKVTENGVKNLKPLDAKCTKSPTPFPTRFPTKLPTSAPTKFPTTAQPTPAPAPGTWTDCGAALQCTMKNNVLQVSHKSQSQAKKHQCYATSKDTCTCKCTLPESPLTCVDTRQRGANKWQYKGRTTAESTCRSWCKGFTYMSLECPTNGGFECFCVNTLSLTGSHGKIATSECQGKPANKDLNNGRNGHCVDPNNKSYKYGNVWGGGWHRGMVYKL